MTLWYLFIGFYASQRSYHAPKDLSYHALGTTRLILAGKLPRPSKTLSEISLQLADYEDCNETIIKRPDQIELEFVLLF